MIPYEKVVVRYGTLIYVKDLNKEDADLWATCPDRDAAYQIALALGDAYGIPIEGIPKELL